MRAGLKRGREAGGWSPPAMAEPCCDNYNFPCSCTGYREAWILAAVDWNTGLWFTLMKMGKRSKFWGLFKGNQFMFTTIMIKLIIFGNAITEILVWISNNDEVLLSI